MGPTPVRKLAGNKRPIPWVPTAGVMGGAELRLKRLRGRTMAGSTRVLVWIRYRNGVFAEGGFDARAAGVGGGKEAGVYCVVHQVMG
jgi:hypothetical protein